jgi:hypothetical protein
MLACGLFCGLMLEHILDLILSNDVVGQERISSADTRRVIDVEEKGEKYSTDVSRKHVEPYGAARI